MHPQPATHKVPQSLRVSSPSFRANGAIPAVHTSDGDDVPPPIAWGSPPPGTKSIAILVEDPDVPNPGMARTWVHWIVTGISPTQTTFDGNHLPAGAVAGLNDWGQRKWMGPNPPDGRHRYFFKVFALDIALGSQPMRKPQLLAAIKGHVLAQGELIGTYQKTADHPHGPH